MTITEASKDACPLVPTVRPTINDEVTPLLTAGYSSIGVRADEHVNHDAISTTQRHSQKSQSSASVASDVEPGQRTTEAVAESASIYATISVLLIGVFISQVDQSLILSTYGVVASHFHDLDSGSWLLSAFIIAQCVAQPLYGKFSDIYGRKSCLQASYLLFAMGTAGCGLGRSIGQVIAARAVQGAGAAGMMSMVSIIITDIAPVHEVAVLRSYVNVLATTGRSAGGVIGGILTQAFGWQWAFLIQCPLTVLGMMLVQWRLKIPPRGIEGETKMQKLQRVDFIGAFLLGIAIFALSFVLDTGGQKFAWRSPIISILAGVGGLSLVAFVLAARVVSEPIFPLHLMAKLAVTTSYLLVLLQSMAQVSLAMVVPLYFQVTERASTSATGAYLIPAFIGNTVGGLLTGYWIKKTGLYKPPNVLAPLVGFVCLLLCYLLWNGHTSILQCTFIFLGGFGMGAVSSSAFVALAVGVSETEIGMAASGMYLFTNLGAVAGTSIGAAVYQTTLQSRLYQTLHVLPNGAEIYRRMLVDITFVQTVDDDIRDRVMPSYVSAFHQVNVFGMVSLAIEFGVALLTKGTRLAV